MINIVLYQPEIPPNTGNIIRLAANTGALLHLIEPLGFTLEDRQLRRAGLDYREFSKLLVHNHWEDFVKWNQSNGNGRLFGLSTKGARYYTDVQFTTADCVVFGPETRGLPAELRQQLGEDSILRIPMLADSRSLNLANAAAVVVYEAWRQQLFNGGG